MTRCPLPLPMIGTCAVVVNAVRPFAIHGDAYLEMHVTLDDGGSDHLVRVPQHAVASVPVAGSRATLTFLMGQVTEVRWA